MSELQPPASPGPVAPANGTRLTLQGWITLCFALVLCASVSFMVEPGTLYLGLALLFALLVAAWSVPHRLRGIEAEWLVPPTIHAGTETTLGCRVRAKAGSAPLRVDAFDPAGGLFLPVSELPGLGRASTRLAWPARFPARGPLLLPPLLVRNEQPFGLVESRRQLGQRREVLVLPAIGVIQRAFHANLHRWLEQGPTSSAPGDEEISHLRAYRQGDPIHRIHWRASARLRTLTRARVRCVSNGWSVSPPRWSTISPAAAGRSPCTARPFPKRSPANDATCSNVWPRWAPPNPRRCDRTCRPAPCAWCSPRAHGSTCAPAVG
ncbi:MAG: DUF58 domain-containing protein [Planctomycetota bacterium]